MLNTSGKLHKYGDETVFGIDFSGVFVYIYIMKTGQRNAARRKPDTRGQRLRDLLTDEARRFAKSTNGSEAAQTAAK